MLIFCNTKEDEQCICILAHNNFKVIRINACYCKYVLVFKISRLMSKVKCVYQNVFGMFKSVAGIMLCL